MSSPVIQIDRLTHTYKRQHSQPLEIAHWQVLPGQRIFLYGESGSGKSTLLSLLSGILTPTSGELSVLGNDLSAMSSAKRDKFRARHIGVVFQSFNLIPYLSVLQNIQLASYFGKRHWQKAAERAKTLLSSLKLSEDILAQPVSQLSIGQQQRVAIVRALINEPELLLVDEPTSALDASARDAFMKMLIDISEQTNTTLIFVSHDQGLKQYFDIQTDIKTLLSGGSDNS